jgi:trans-2,3-dihydro-3-hydroxyanthranilate isomerase
MLRYEIVDVFTDRPFAGNQLAVIHGTEGLSDEQLRALACEFNYSESAFPSQVTADGYRVRIFTPESEIPFAGHPTLGTAWALRAAGLLEGPEVTQHCGVGPIEVTLGEQLVSMATNPRDLAACPDDVASRLLESMALSASDLAGDPYLAGCGLTFVYLPLTDEAVTRALPGTLAPEPLLHDMALADPIGGIDLYAVAGDRVHVRTFAPGLGVVEDPATGSAAAGLGVVLAASGVLPDGGEVVVRQGIEIERPSTLQVRVEASGGRARLVHVAGQVQPIASGEIRVP